MPTGYNDPPKSNLQSNTPLAEVIVAGNATPVALQGGTSTTDSNGNVIAPAGVNLQQVGGVAYATDGFGNLPVTEKGHLNNDGNTVISASAVTTTQTSGDQSNPQNRGLYIVVNVTTLAGTSPTLTPKLQGKGPVAGVYFQIGAALTAIAATGIFVYLYSLSAPASAGGITATAAFPMPRTWNFVMTAGGTITNATYTVEAIYLL